MEDFKKIDLSRIPVGTRLLTIVYFLCKAGVVRFDMNIAEHRNILKTVVFWINAKNNELLAKGATSCSNRLLLGLIYYCIVKNIIPARQND